jgi:uncharacterized protein YkwD
MRASTNEPGGEAVLGQGRRTRRTALVAVLAGTLVFGALAAPAADASPKQRQLLSILNRIRERHDLQALGFTKSLTDETRKHTRKMIRRGELFDPPNLADILDAYPWRYVGADVVGCHESLQKMVRQWMGEDFHHDIILNPHLRRAGLSVVYVDGKSACGRDNYWATVIMYG